MTTQAAQLQFAAEFTLFIAAIAAVAVTALRPTLLVRSGPPRSMLVAGSLALAASAFLHGSLLVDDGSAAGLVILRVFGLLAIIASLIRWQDVPTPRTLAAAAVVTLAGAEVAAAGDNILLGDGIRGVGAIIFAIALLAASRRAIAARIAMSAAFVVLLVITTLSIALSVVIAENVEDEVARQYEARAETESQVFAESSRSAATQSVLLARALRGGSLPDKLATVLSPDASPEQVDAAIRAIEAALVSARENVLSIGNPGPLLAVGPTGRTIAAIDASDSVRIPLVGSDVVIDATESRRSRETVAIVSDLVLSIGASPINEAGSGRFLGVAAVTEVLDDRFLERRIGDPSSVEQGIGLALADRTNVFGRAGTQASLESTLAVAADVLREGDRRTAVAGDRFVVGVPLLDDDGAPFLAVVVNVPQARIDATRTDLFRYLFLVALGAALVAMILAGYAGNRIGSSIAQLTTVAGELQQRRFGARAAVESPDELGVLGTTFNQMAFSLETMTDDLRQAADDEAALRARLQGVVGGMGEALVAVGPRGQITDFNAAAEELFGMTAREALGGTLYDLCTVLGEDDVNLTQRFVKPVIEPFTLSVDVHPRGGDPVPVAASAAPLRNNAGTLTGAVFVLRDVRREREIEQMKTEFIANVSHELRTPLTPVLGYSDLLATRELDPDRTRLFATEINSAAKQLGRITDQLVQFATLAAGRLQLSQDSVQIVEILDAAVNDWRSRLPEGLIITRRVARGMPEVIADRRYLEVVLKELVDNAVKYSPDGGRIRLSASLHDRAGRRMLLLAVDDQGVGIEPERRDQIFDDFSQGDGSATRRFGGLGLGLALVSRIVRAHGGQLTCSSTVGEGTTVRVLLPIAPVVEPDPPKPTNGAASTNGHTAAAATSSPPQGVDR